MDFGGFGFRSRGYYLYQKLFGSRDLFSYVPSNAVLVYSTPHMDKGWQALETSPVASFLKESYEKMDPATPLSDSTFRHKLFMPLVAGKEVLMSLHTIGARKFDFLFVVRIQKDDDSFLGRLEDPDVTRSERQFRSKKLWDFFYKRAVDPFMTLWMDGEYLVGSQQAVLVEDAVRCKVEGEGFFRQEGTKRLKESNLMNARTGGFYVNVASWSRFLSIFRRQPKEDALWQGVRGHVGLDAKVSSERILFSGFLTLPPRDSSFLKSFARNPAPEGTLLSFVPNEASYVLSYSFGEANEWNVRMLSHWQNTRSAVAQARIEAFSEQQVDIDALFRHVGQHAAYVELESGSGLPPEALFIVETRAPEPWIAIASDTKTSGSENSYYTELQNLPYLLFGEDFKGFAELFYVMYNEFLIGSSSSKTLEYALLAIKNEATWGKTPSFVRQLEGTLPAAQVSLFVQMDKIFPRVAAQSHETWAQRLRQIQLGSASPTSETYPLLMGIQYNYTEANKFYTQALFTVPKWVEPGMREVDRGFLAVSQPEDEVTSDSYERQHVLQFAAPLRTKPMVVYSQKRRDFVCFVQDDSLKLYATNAQLTIEWFKSLKEEMASPVFLVHLEPRQEHYLFATQTQLHALDKEGRYVSGFPVKLPTEELVHLSVVDYDKNKRYRFFLSDTQGRLFLTDKTGRLLSGWDPKQLSGPLSQAPFHIRLGDIDAMVAWQQDGTLQAFRRTGKVMSGFPVALGERSRGTLFVRPGRSLSKAEATLLGEQGTQLRINFKGRTLNKKAWIRQGADSQFEMILDNSRSQHFVVVERQKGKLVVFNREGQELFSADLPSSDEAHIQYYNFGAEHKLLVITNVQQQVSRFFDLSGQEVLPALASAHRVAMIFKQSQQAYLVHRTLDNEYGILKHRKLQGFRE